MLLWQKQLTACELKIVELGDNEQLTAVFLEGQVTEPLKYYGHLLSASVDKRRRGTSGTLAVLTIVPSLSIRT